MFKNKSTTNISSLGEFKLIEHLTKSFTINHKSSKLGVGDDAAILDYNNKQIVVTTDMLTEGIHFNLMYTPLKHLGYKSVIVNLSDIYSMNAIAKQITVSIAISSKFTLEAVEELYKGIQIACNNYNIDLIGGDTTSSEHGLIISITAIGEIKEERITKRSGAKENDLVCVTGDLGAAYMGLHILEREAKIFKESSDIQPDLVGHDYIIERQLKPEACLWLIQEFEKHNIIPTSMIDISDGLSSELKHICKQSNCGVQIYEEKIPIDFKTSSVAEDFKIAPTVCALNGGEDYEMLFTISTNKYEKINAIDNIHIIGHITKYSNGQKLIGIGGDSIELKSQGWDSFTTSSF